MRNHRSWSRVHTSAFSDWRTIPIMLLLSDRMDSPFYSLCSKTCVMRSTYLSVGRTLPRSISVELSMLKYFVRKICLSHFFVIVISIALSTVCFVCSTWIYFHSLLAILRTSKTEEWSEDRAKGYVEMYWTRWVYRCQVGAAPLNPLVRGICAKLLRFLHMPNNENLNFS